MTNSKKRKLRAILFADIIGYTSLMQKDEAKASLLLEKFRSTLNEKVKQHQGEVINFYGDGCLCTFESAVDAMNCAKAVQVSFQKDPIVPVRIGLHSGDVFFEADNVYGDSVNIASRIESLGVAGSILFSEPIKRHISNQKEFDVQSLGEFDFKNVDKTMEVFALANEGMVVPDKKDIKGKIKPTRLTNRQWIIPVMLGVVLMALASYWYVSKNKAITTLTVTPSIAVLPFDDMSANKDQAYFGDGIAEEILNTLAKLKELKVAGRTSSFSFKDKGATISEIGKALKVNHVLEGSIRKQGEKIRITTQLIKVDDGFHVWSETYDRDFTDIFALQDELAQKIGTILLDKLAPEQISTLTNDLHQNSEAYELYLKAKHLHLHRYRINFKREDFKLVEALFLEAIELDSNYALAHAGLADLYDTHRIALNDSTELKYYEDLKLKESEIAIRLNPELAYVQLVRGWCLIYREIGIPDYETAFKHFLKSYELDPHSGVGALGLASFYGDIGLAGDGLQFSDKAIELDPTTPNRYAARGISLFQMGELDLILENNLAALILNPDNIGALSYLAMSYFWQNKKEEALAIFQQVEKMDTSYIEKNLHFSIPIALLKGDTAKAKSIDPDSWIYYDFIGNYSKAEELVLKEYENYSTSRDYELKSKYNYYSKFPKFNKYRHKPAFQEIIKKEKEKYDRFLKKYPRASEVIVKPLKN